MIVVVGGHSRNIGKTSVVVNVISALADYRWTAIKVTQFGHGVCARSGEDCGCSIEADHSFAISRETDGGGRTDTSRYLAAGAAASYWVRTRAGELGFAMPTIKRMLKESENSIVESNSVMRFVRPDVFMVVLDPDTQDFKESTRLYLDRADALLISSAGANARWDGVPARLLRRKPVFSLGADFSLTPDLMDFLRGLHKVPAVYRR